MFTAIINSPYSFVLLLIAAMLLTLVGAYAVLASILLAPEHPAHPASLSTLFSKHVNNSSTLKATYQAYYRVRELVWRRQSPDSDPFAGPMHKLP